MKVLGINKEKETFIVEIEEDEIANLFGLYARYEDRKSFDEKISIGDDIDVSSLYNDHEKLEEMRQNIKNFSRFFVEMADVMNKFQIET